MRRGPSSARSAPSSGPLTGMAELHDLSFEYQIAPLLRLLDQETELIPDLRRPRPWLAAQLLDAPQFPDAAPSPDQVLAALLEGEWAGFVARLGRLGPWVFAPSVADLQALSAAYTLLVERAAGSDLSGQAPASLLGRLWNSGERSGQAFPDTAVQAEADFWLLAASRAARQRAEWASRRAGR